jgi:hypothetical protein
MLHFTQQHVPVLRLHGGSRDSRSLARFRDVALHECRDERGGGGEKLDRVLTEIALASRALCLSIKQQAEGIEVEVQADELELSIEPCSAPWPDSERDRNQ